MTTKKKTKREMNTRQRVIDRLAELFRELGAVDVIATHALDALREELPEIYVAKIRPDWTKQPDASRTLATMVIDRLDLFAIDRAVIDATPRRRLRSRDCSDSKCGLIHICARCEWKLTIGNIVLEQAKLRRSR